MREAVSKIETKNSILKRSWPPDTIYGNHIKFLTEDLNAHNKQENKFQNLTGKYQTSTTIKMK